MDHLDIGELLNRVSEESDIYEVVSKYTYLRPKGKLFVGRCPFHDDNEESLTVNDKKKSFYCSGCHAGGSIFKFISMSEGCTLRDAVKLQAKRVRVSLFEFEGKKTFEDEKIERKQREILELNEYAQDFYHKILTEKQAGESCRKYLESRGISKTAAKKFGLGFAPVSDKNITIFLDSYGFSNELALMSGLVTLEGNILVDNFQDCIVVPFKEENKIIGLVGQIFNFDKKIFYETDGISARFILTKGLPFFDATEQIFGFEEARTAIIKSDRVLIVDEPLTAIFLKGEGIEDVVAILDNRLTKNQADFLATYAKQIIFCLRDGERLKFDVEALSYAGYGGGKVFVAALPQTPENFILDEGVEKFRLQLKNIQPCENYKHFIKIESNPVQENDFIDIGEQIRNLRLSMDTTAKRRAEEVILRVCRYNYQIIGYVMNMAVADIFSRNHQDIFRYFLLCYEEDKEPDEEGARKFLHEAAYNELIQILQTDCTPEQDTNAFDEAINLLTGKILSVEYSKVRKDFLENPAESDSNITKLSQIFEMRQAI